MGIDSLDTLVSILLMEKESLRWFFEMLNDVAVEEKLMEMVKEVRVVIA